MRIIMLLIVAGLALMPPRARAEDRTLTVTNRASHGITELRASGARDDDWGANRLAAGTTIPPGRAATLHLPGTDCAYDLQAKYDDGRIEERRGVDVCRTRQMALDGSRAAAPAAPRAAVANAMLLNGTPRTITEVYVSPASANDWGHDRLGQDQLPAGQALSVDFVGGCRQDVRVVYDNKAAEERRGLDLCAHARLRIVQGWVLSPELDAPAEPAAPEDAPREVPAPRPAPPAVGPEDHIRYVLPTR
jgi:hypothetical protein